MNFFKGPLFEASQNIQKMAKGPFTKDVRAEGGRGGGGEIRTNSDIGGEGGF